jgi:hypothetical protein
MCEIPTNSLVFSPIDLTSLTHALLFSGKSHITFMPLMTRTMVHHILRGRPLQTWTDIQAKGGEGKGKDNIILPRQIVHLLKIQLAPHTMHMDSTHTWSPILPSWSKMCNVSMSMRIQSCITCWCNNDKQISHGWDKREESTRLSYWLRRDSTVVYHWAPYDSLHMDDASLSELQLDVMYDCICVTYVGDTCVVWLTYVV